MDNKTKETIRNIKYNYIALNILLVSMFIFLVALFIVNNAQIKQLAKQNDLSNIEQDILDAKNTIVSKIDEQSQNTNNNIIVSIYQNEDIKQRLDEISSQRNRY